jgi:hypothetical protein
MIYMIFHFMAEVDAVTKWLCRRGYETVAAADRGKGRGGKCQGRGVRSQRRKGASGGQRGGIRRLPKLICNNYLIIFIKNKSTLHTTVYWYDPR